jgi:hypothetical protein
VDEERRVDLGHAEPEVGEGGRKRRRRAQLAEPRVSQPPRGDAGPEKNEQLER